MEDQKKKRGLILSVIVYCIVTTALLILFSVKQIQDSVLKYRQAREIVILESSYPELSDWQLLQLAIIKTESDFKEDAVGKTKDLGCMQITPIYVQEINRILDLDQYTHLDALDIQKSLEMYDIYQDAKNPEHNIHKAISLHNPNGDTIGYATRVMANYKYLEKIEQYRKLIISKDTK